MFQTNNQTFMQSVVTTELDEFVKSVDPSKLIEHGDESF